MATSLVSTGIQFPDATIQTTKAEGIPAGSVAYFAMSSPPSGWVKANGAAISRSTYSSLFSAIGTTWGSGDGSTTFNVPDLRGEFARNWDDGRGQDSGRGFASYQGDAIRNITGGVYTAHSLGLFASSDYGAVYKWPSYRGSVGGGGGSSYWTGFYFDASRVVPTAADNRPTNVAALACIKY
jgi:phage-related tail fiber protein